MWKCKHCSTEFLGLGTSEKANHSRWCDENPKKSTYNKDLEKARASKTTFKNQYSYGAVCSEETRKKLSENQRGRKHSAETKEVIREKALRSKHRRVLRSTRTYTKVDGSVVLLDSSWEEALAKRLDFLGVNWIRPGSVKWVDSVGVEHNYFPDFYLPDHDIYLDPKNDIVYRMTLEKIEKVTKLLPNLRIIRSLEECEAFTV